MTSKSGTEARSNGNGKKTARIVNQEYRLLPVAKMTPHPKNPRRGDLDSISESIKANKFYGAVVIQKSTGHILIGNHRYRAALKAGIDKLPAIVADVDDLTAEKIMLSDNRTSDLASYDDTALLAILEEISHGDAALLLGTGFDEHDLTRLGRANAIPSDLPEYDAQVKVTYTCPKCSYVWS